MIEIISPLFHTLPIKKAVYLLNQMTTESAAELIVSSLDSQCLLTSPFEEEFSYPTLTPNDLALRLGALPPERSEAILLCIKKNAPHIYGQIFELQRSPEVISTLPPYIIERILFDFSVERLAVALYPCHDVTIECYLKGLSKRRICHFWERTHSHPIEIEEIISARLNLMMHYDALVASGICLPTLCPCETIPESEVHLDALKKKCNSLKEEIDSYDDWVVESLLRELSKSHSTILTAILSSDSCGVSTPSEIAPWESAIRQIHYALKGVLETNNITTRDDIESFQMIYFRMCFAGESVNMPLLDSLSIDSLKCLAWIFTQLEGPNHLFSNELLHAINNRSQGATWYPWPKPVPKRSDLYALRDAIHQAL